MTSGFTTYAPLLLDLTALAGVLALGAFLRQNRRRYGRWVLAAPASKAPDAFLTRVFHEQARKAHQSLSDLLHGEFEALHRLTEVGADGSPGAGRPEEQGGANGAGEVPDRHRYAQAARLAADGASSGAIAAQLGMRQGEAQLVVNLERCAGRRA